MIGALIAAGGWLLAQMRTIVVPVAVALLLTVLLKPVRAGLERRLHFPRGLAVATSILGLIAAVSVLIWLAGRQIVNGFTDLADQAVAGFGEMREWLSHGPLGLGNEQVDAYWDRFTQFLSDGDWLQSAASGALGAAATAGHMLVGLLIAIFCTIFFLLDGRSIWTWLVNLLPVRARERVHQAGRRGMVSLSAYVRTQILVALVDAAGIGIGAAFFVPTLALPLGILVFIGSFVPIIGAIVTGSVAVAVVLVSQGWVAALIMLAIVLAVQQIEGHVLQPFLMGHAVSLHPVAVVLVVATGSMAAGIVGALFAVPLAAVINTVMLYFHGTDKFPDLGTDDHVPLLRRRPEFPGLRRPVRAGAAGIASDDVDGPDADPSGPLAGEDDAR